MFRRGNTIVEPDRVKGLVDICCERSTTRPSPCRRRGTTCPSPPAAALADPAPQRRQGGQALEDRRRLPPFRKAAAFHLLYSRDTRQNHRACRGFYCYFLAHDWASGSLPNGDYVIEVGATDIRGNRGFGRFRFTIANGVETTSRL